MDFAASVIDFLTYLFQSNFKPFGLKIIILCIVYVGGVHSKYDYIKFQSLPLEKMLRNSGVYAREFCVQMTDSLLPIPGSAIKLALVTESPVC